MSIASRQRGCAGATRAVRTTPAAPRPGVAMTVLVATDLVGGLLPVSTGVNTWAEAWGARHS